MAFKDLIQMYSDWNGVVVVNDDNLNPIVKGSIHDLSCFSRLNDKKVVSYRINDRELSVRIGG